MIVCLNQDIFNNFRASTQTRTEINGLELQCTIPCAIEANFQPLPGPYGLTCTPFACKISIHWLYTPLVIDPGAGDAVLTRA